MTLPQPRTIDEVATSITAFVGRARRGPVDLPVVVGSETEFEKTFGGLWEHSALGHAVWDFFYQGGARAIVVRVHQPSPGDTATIVLGTGPSQLTLEAASPGAWGGALSAVVDNRGVDPNDPTAFNLTVVDEGTGRVERFPGVSLYPRSKHRLDAVLEQRSRLVRLPGELSSAILDALPQQAGAAGGNDGAPLSADSFTGPDLRSAQRGLYALDRVELVNLIVIPPYTASGDVDGQVITDAIAYATERRAIAIIDAPTGWVDAASAKSGVSDPGFPVSENAALYFPGIRHPDPHRGSRAATFAPSGAVAGVIARTDASRGVWKTPAGLSATLDGVTGLSVQLDEDQVGELNALGVNCLKPVAGAGYCIWGARTRAGSAATDSEWQYLSVRRTAVFIEESVDRGTRWVAFEPNGEPTWEQIRIGVGDFLNGLFQQGAFAGHSPEDSYFVKCDSTTTTAADIERGLVGIEVGFAPLKPAEFVVIELKQRAGETDVRRRRGRMRMPKIRRRGRG